MSLFGQIGQFFHYFEIEIEKKRQDNLIIFVADLRWRAQGQESMIPNNGLVFSLGLASYFRSLWIYFDSLDKNNARFWIVRVFSSELMYLNSYIIVFTSPWVLLQSILTHFYRQFSFLLYFFVDLFFTRPSRISLITLEPQCLDICPW